MDTEVPAMDGPCKGQIVKSRGQWPDLYVRLYVPEPLPLVWPPDANYVKQSIRLYTYRLEEMQVNSKDGYCRKFEYRYQRD